MLNTNLRKIGGSTMMLVPPVFLEQLNLQSGSMVGLTLSNGCLVVEPKPRRKYTMAQLLAESDFTNPDAACDRDWLDAPAVGGELL